MGDIEMEKKRDREEGKQRDGEEERQTRKKTGDRKEER